MMEMAANATVVSVEAYLRMNDKPAFEYRDGELTQKHLPTWNDPCFNSESHS